MDIIQYNGVHKFVGVLDNPQIEEPEELLDVRIRTSLHTAFGFFSLLDGCHWDIGIK